MANVVCGEEKAAGAVGVLDAEHVNAGERAKKEPDRERGSAIGEVVRDAAGLSHPGW